MAPKRSFNGIADTPHRAADTPRSAGVPPAVPRASRPPFRDITKRSRGYLPHWEIDGSVYFITFRLADSLPQSVIQRIELQVKQSVTAAEQAGRSLTINEHRRLSSLISEKIEAHLDLGAGSCVLAKPQVAGIVSNALRHFDGKRYRLFAWCVMPNHVHVVAKPLPAYLLSSLLHSWKSFTAKEINESLGRKGTLWQHEYYDHLIRDEDEFRHKIQYVLDNPAKAGLKDWPWVWMCGQDARGTAGGTPALRE